MHLPISLLSAAFLLVSTFAHAADPAAPSPASTPAPDVAELKAGGKFSARDTMKTGPETVADAAACLAGLNWADADFPVKIEAGTAGANDWLVRFPSPFPSGDAVNDEVCMEWHIARDAAGQPIKAPAIVVVHESGRGMVVGRTFARGLRNLGLHTFLIHLPGYGARTSEFTRDIKQMLPALKQAVGDVRRARDAVAALPYVDSRAIGLQGTSLGGFVVAAVAGLDRGYDKTFVVLAGGQIAEVLLTGKRDAASMRRQFAAAGMTDTQIRDLSQVIEPMRLAHRVDPARLWMFTGKYDDVVPPACSEVFADAAKLTATHRYILPVGHYSGALLLPAIVPEIAKLMLQPVAEIK
jgi:dienelactone hydrolase